MRCAKVSYQLQLYIDRQLTLKQTRLLEAHLASCHACCEELASLEAVTSRLRTIVMVQEPPTMHAQIMQKVALSVVRKQPVQQAARFSLLRPTLAEILAAVFLATVATLSILLQQPALRAVLPIANGHDPLSLFYMQVVHMLMSIDANTLLLALWVVGTLLGVCITLAFAGAEMRTQWLKSVLDRRPVR